MASNARLGKIAANLWTGVSGSPVAADVAAPILEGVRVIVSIAIIMRAH